VLTLPLRTQLLSSRLGHVGPDLDPIPLICSAFHPEMSAACLHGRPPTTPRDVATIVGTYEPFTYVVPGVVMQLGHDAEGATLLGRSGFWVMSGALLSLAVFLLWSRRSPGWSLLGLSVAVTPMVVFMTSNLSANGLEIAAGLCYLAAILRLARADEDGGCRPLCWWAVGAGGSVLALSRATGPLWVVLATMLLVAVAGGRRTLALVRSGGRRAAVAITVVVVSVVATTAWEIVVQPQPRRDLHAAARDVPDAVGLLPDLARQSLGEFGWLDTRMPAVAYAALATLIVGLVLMALVVGRRRQRVVLCTLVVASVAVTIGVDALNRPTGFGVQARYVLAFLVVVPLYAGEVLLERSRTGRQWARWLGWLPPTVAVTAAGVHLTAWYTNARRYAVGRGGPLLFVDRPQWEPPLGWPFWIVVAMAATGCLALGGILAFRRTAGELSPAELSTGAGA
jgi:hypothetical protein